MEHTGNVLTHCPQQVPLPRVLPSAIDDRFLRRTFEAELDEARKRTGSCWGSRELVAKLTLKVMVWHDG